MSAGGVGDSRGARAEVDLGAIRANVATLAGLAGPAALMVVVKADGYGHGAVPVARAAVEAGTRWLGVALVEEGAELRAAGIDTRVLLLAEPPPDAAPEVLTHGLTPVVYRPAFADALADAVAASGAPSPLPVHLKVDTGMHRVGCAPGDVLRVAKAVTARDELSLEGLMTHLAVADEPEHEFTAEQLRRFEAVRGELASAGIEPPVVHAANSAGTICHPEARYDLVRCGIAVYGIPPAPALAGRARLEPALTLKAPVAYVQRIAAGEAISYGQHHRLTRDATVATVPLGYGDGVARRLFSVGGEVLVRGRRYPVAGAVTMDQFMVDCGDDPVEVGDEVMLVGRQGGDEITANDVAQRLDTIGYEITCAVGPRVPRRYVGA